ncbi:hypothetical protein BGX21_010410 [Mortierella sp. AD011]|nr:hypothetical protein BGX20_008848 [Mortierella sp. AD010]KAF9394333.1 hypothetical protein BGX21_010410 [Mortierella sp. AD011]
MTFQKYKSDLHRIAASNDVSAVSRRRAKKIAENITQEIFEEQYEDYSLSGSKRKAENAMLGAFYDIIQGAGSRPLNISAAGSSNGKTLKRTNSSMSEDSISGFSDRIKADTPNSGYCTPPEILNCIRQPVTRSGSDP